MDLDTICTRNVWVMLYDPKSSLQWHLTTRCWLKAIFWLFILVVALISLRGNSKCIFSQKIDGSRVKIYITLLHHLYPASLVHSCSWICLILVSNAPLFLFFFPFYKMLLLYFNWFDHQIFQSFINHMFGVNKLILVVWNCLWS